MPKRTEKGTVSQNVTMTETQAKFVERFMEDRHYATFSEVVREGLRLLEDRESIRAERIERAVQLAVENLKEIDNGTNKLIPLEEFLENPQF